MDHISAKIEPPSFRLDGRVAMITGAGAGIGRGLAVALADVGASLHLLGRRQEPLQELAEEIKSRFGTPIDGITTCDVTDSAALRSAIGGLDKLDIFINNAATNIPEPFLDVPDEHLDAMIDLNVRATFIGAQAAVRKMLEDPQRAARFGSIINMSSQMGHVGSPNRVPYCMTKHAVEGFTKALAIELAPQKIRVNSIGPTFTRTPLISRIVNTPEKTNFLVSKIPLGDMARIEDMLGAAVYLASSASAWVTGTCLLVDGGWTAQ